MSTETAPKSQTTPQNEQPLLQVKGLKVGFVSDGEIAHAVNGVSFDLRRNEVLGIVGESGSGKSVTSLSIMRLIPDPPGKITDGEILFHGEDILKFDYKQVRKMRGNEIAMIFQEPMTALNPVFTIGMQVMETILTHEKVKKKEAFNRAVEMLTRVGIPDAAKRMNDYPHQFSGGMRQRVMIALALVCHPQILIADEPTTALDVTTQAQILELMRELQVQREHASIILITHDLAVVAETCDRVVVLYGGMVQEIGTAEQIFDAPAHPYTKGLLASLPQLGAEKQSRLYCIPGSVPNLQDMPVGCKFCNRCEASVEAGIQTRCETEEPPLHQLANGQLVRCHLLEDQAST